MNKLAINTTVVAPDTAQPNATWTVSAVEALFNLPFNDLMFQAQNIHRQHFDANVVQLSTLV